MRARRDEQDDEDDLSEWAEGDSDAESEVIPCPACGEEVYEDAEKCPYCGAWITPGTEADRRSRGWFWPVMVAVLIAVILGVWLRAGR